MAKDPVCGMQVNEQDAVRSNNQNETYYFCSNGCKQAFDKNPKQYAGQQPAEGQCVPWQQVSAERKTA